MGGRHHAHLRNRASRRKNRIVDALQLPGQEHRPLNHIDQAQRFLTAFCHDYVQRTVHAAGPKILRLALVQHHKPGIEPGCNRVLPQQPIAETMDRRNPATLQFPQPDGIAAKLSRQPRLHVCCRFFGESNGQNLVRIHALPLHQALVPLHQNRSLPRPWPGHYTGVQPSVFDGRLLFRSKLTRLCLRQTGFRQAQLPQPAPVPVCLPSRDTLP